MRKMIIIQPVASFRLLRPFYKWCYFLGKGTALAYPVHIPPGGEPLPASDHKTNFVNAL